MSEWWTAAQGAWMGAMGGSAVGVLGAVFGTMAGILAPRGRCKGLVVGGIATLAIAGYCILTVGIVAVAAKQPYHVWYPLVLAGGILGVVASCILPGIVMRYRHAEARRMDAEGLRRS